MRVKPKDDDGERNLPPDEPGHDDEMAAPC